MTSDSSSPLSVDHRTAVDNMAGVLAAASIALSGLAFAVTPALLAPIAAIVAFVAGRMSSRNETLALAAVIISVIAFVVGMTLAVITENPLL
ncbi:MAG: hypothetical protein FJW96_15630 [Actinobacteria bacterium]|nr:hypothetical protein [Actinomycetota bacterium]